MNIWRALGGGMLVAAGIFTAVNEKPATILFILAGACFIIDAFRNP